MTRSMSYWSETRTLSALLLKKANAPGTAWLAVVPPFAEFYDVTVKAHSAYAPIYRQQEKKAARDHRDEAAELFIRFRLELRACQEITASSGPSVGEIV